MNEFQEKEAGVEVLCAASVRAELKRERNRTAGDGTPAPMITSLHSVAPWSGWKNSATASRRGQRGDRVWHHKTRNYSRCRGMLSDKHQRISQCRALHTTQIEV